MIFSILTILVTFILSLALTNIVRRVLVARAVMDIPNERSSHKIPTPRGGGWGLMGVILPALIAASLYIDGDARHVFLIAAMFLLVGISWLDDRHDVSAGKRLSLHIFAACLGSFCFAPDQLMLGGVTPLWLDRTLMILGWVWFINLYNFMDGIDGITSVETISIATGLCLVMSAAGIENPYVGFLTLILTGACLGFLAYNWHPAKLFMGDIGSIPLGYLTGFCLLTLATQGYLAAALILPLYYLADSGITITRRALKGEKIWQAHRQHFYQISAAKAGHARVSTFIAICNTGLILAAILSVFHVFWGLVAAILIVVVLLIKMHKMAGN